MHKINKNLENATYQYNGYKQKSLTLLLGFKSSLSWARTKDPLINSQML